MFDYLQGIEKEYGTQIIIFYHPEESLNKDGDIVFHSSEYLTAFSKYAEKHGIDFIDMTEPFINMYYKDHLVAHGFVTGELGSGHLNANGHAAAAEEIYQAILKLEEDGTL